MKRRLIKYDPGHTTNIVISEIAKKNKEENLSAPQQSYNQDIVGFERKFVDLTEYDKRLDEVNPNNERDDGWAEVKEAQILARKKLVSDVRLLDKIKEDIRSTKRDKLRAMEQTYNIATEKVGPRDKGNAYNINTLIQVLTGNK